MHSSAPAFGNIWVKIFPHNFHFLHAFSISQAWFVMGFACLKKIIFFYQWVSFLFIRRWTLCLYAFLVINIQIMTWVILTHVRQSNRIFFPIVRNIVGFNHASMLFHIVHLDFMFFNKIPDSISRRFFELFAKHPAPWIWFHRIRGLPFIPFQIINLYFSPQLLLHIVINSGCWLAPFQSTDANSWIFFAFGPRLFDLLYLLFFCIIAYES